MKAIIAEMQRRANASYYDDMTVEPRKQKDNSVHGSAKHILTIHGEELTYKQASEKFGIKVSTLKTRVGRGMTGDDLVDAKPREYATTVIGGKEMTIAEIAEICGVRQRTIRTWLQDGVDVEERIRSKQ